MTHTVQQTQPVDTSQVLPEPDAPALHLFLQGTAGYTRMQVHISQQVRSRCCCTIAVTHEAASDLTCSSCRCRDRASRHVHLVVEHSLAASHMHSSAIPSMPNTHSLPLLLMYITAPPLLISRTSARRKQLEQQQQDPPAMPWVLPH